MISTLSIYYQNVRGLRTKTSQFFRNVCLNSYDIISITESWLLDSIGNSEVFDSRYVVWRRDRDYARTAQIYGGGVMLAVHRDLVSLERIDWRSSAEDMWVTIMTNDRSYKIHICTVYLCTENNGNSFNQQLQNFTDRLNEIILSNPLDKFIILGDFNMTNLIWTRVTGSSDLSPSGAIGEQQRYFLDTINTLDLGQYNSHLNINDRLLDLALSNCCLNISISVQPLVNEDVNHKSIIIKGDFEDFRLMKNKPQEKYIYNSADFSSISTELNSFDWPTVLSKGSVDEATSEFYNILYELRDKHIPKKSIKANKHPPWFSSALIKILREKWKYHQRFKIYGNMADYMSFSLLRERAKALERDNYSSYISNIESSLVKNPKNFWSFVKAKNKSMGLPNSMKYNGVEANTGEDIADLFAHYFHSTFLQPEKQDQIPKMTENSICTGSISSVEIRDEEVLKLLKSIDLTKSGGPDTIPPLFITNCAESLVKPLVILFKRSLSEGCVPKIWKSAFVTPLHKKGDRSSVENYRPISKLCIFAKIFEKIVFTQVYAVLKSSFSDEQHGFLRNRSTTSNLLIANEFITKGMESGSQVDVLFTDYSKCFDRIDHCTLLRQISAAGIHGDLYRWFASYIENRSQAAVVQGFTSDWTAIPSGVPQGSLVGPLLFVIFIMGISNCFLNSKIVLFADDMKVLKEINNLKDTADLQQDLNRFEIYCAEHKLDLNISKCYYISYSRKLTTVDSGYKLKGCNLTRVDYINDLGVVHDSKLLFDKHVQAIVKKSYKALGFIMRTSSDFCHLKSVKVLYCAYVRSNLEYASEVWNPQYEIYKSRIESIQKRFLRYLDFKSRQVSRDYEHRCKRYHFLPLQMRRDISDICYLMKICKGIIDCPELLSKINFFTNQLAFRRRPLLRTTACKTNYRSNSFLFRACRTFNDVKVDIDLFHDSIPAVKKSLSDTYFNG